MPKPVVVFFATVRRIFAKPETAREVVHEADDVVSHRGTWHLSFVVEPDLLDGGYVAACPEIPGAMSQGDSEREALDNLVDAVTGIVTVQMGRNFEAARVLAPASAGPTTFTVAF